MATKKKTTAGAKSSAKTSAKTAKTAKNTKASAGVEYIASRMKTVGGLSILESLAVGVLGGLLIWNSTGMTKLIFYVVGIFLIVKGVYKVINYFVAHSKNDFYNNDLFYGIIALVFGIISVVFWEQLGGAISLVVGAWMVYGALVRMNAAIKLRELGVKEWFYVLLLSFVMLALGIYMIISMSAISMIVGWIMIAAAVVGIVDDVVFIRNVDKIAK